jgi:hypothetical protein
MHRTMFSGGSMSSSSAQQRNTRQMTSSYLTVSRKEHASLSHIVTHLEPHKLEIEVGHDANLSGIVQGPVLGFGQRLRIHKVHHHFHAQKVKQRANEIRHFYAQ